MPLDASSAADASRQALTAAEFHAAVNRCPQEAAPLATEQLQNLESAIRRRLPKAARLAQQFAEGGVSGEPVLRLFLPFARGAELVWQEVQPLEKALWDARRRLGMASRPYTPEAQGAAATVALAHVLKRVADAVWEIAYGWGFAVSEDGDDWPHANEVLTWGTTALALQQRFATAFAFPDPAPLLHEMRGELMELDGRQARREEGHGLAVAAGLCDDEPAVPTASAARSKKGKADKQEVKQGDEPAKAPLTAEQAWPVYIVRPPDRPVPVVAVGGRLEPTPPPEAPPSQLTPQQTCRLRIDKQALLLDGQPVSLSHLPLTQQDEVLCFLGHLIRVAPAWISGSDINRKERKLPGQGLSGTRWDRVRGCLPEEVDALIQAQAGRGYRLPQMGVE